MHGRQNREKVLFTMSRHTVLVVFVLNALIGWLHDWLVTSCNQPIRSNSQCIVIDYSQ